MQCTQVAVENDAEMCSLRMLRMLFCTGRRWRTHATSRKTVDDVRCWRKSGFVRIRLILQCRQNRSWLQLQSFHFDTLKMSDFVLIYRGTVSSIDHRTSRSTTVHSPAMYQTSIQVTIHSTLTDSRQFSNDFSHEITTTIRSKFTSKYFSKQVTNLPSVYRSF